MEKFRSSAAAAAAAALLQPSWSRRMDCTCGTCWILGFSYPRSVPIILFYPFSLTVLYGFVLFGFWRSIQIIHLLFLAADRIIAVIIDSKLYLIALNASKRVQWSPCVFAVYMFITGSDLLPVLLPSTSKFLTNRCSSRLSCKATLRLFDRDAVHGFDGRATVRYRRNQQFHSTERWGRNLEGQALGEVDTQQNT